MGEFTPYLIIAVGIAVVLGLIIFARLNAFLALISAALVVSFLTTDDYTRAVPRVAEAFGTGAGKIGLVIGFAAVIGEAMMRSGAADRIVIAFLKLLGEKRAPLALTGSGFVLSVPVFFDTVFYLLVPLARSLYRSTRRNYLLSIMAISAGGAITHTLVPPTPGPLAMAENLGFPVGVMIPVGALVALPSALAGLAFARVMQGRIQVTEPDFGDEPTEDENASAASAAASRISLAEALLPVLLPVLLISGDTVVTTIFPDQEVTETAAGAEITDDEQAVATAGRFEDTLKTVTGILGNPALALLISMVLSLWTWVRIQKPEAKEFGHAVETALLSGGLVILITAAGYSFGEMLKSTGMADDIQRRFADSQAAGLSAVFLCFGLASLLKVAQGSSTTAMITVSSIMAAMGLTSQQLGFHPVYLATSIGAGSLVGSWMNDSGFWIVSKMSGFSEKEALKTWTPLLVVLGVTSLLTTLVLTQVMPMVD